MDGCKMRLMTWQYGRDRRMGAIIRTFDVGDIRGRKCDWLACVSVFSCIKRRTVAVGPRVPEWLKLLTRISCFRWKIGMGDRL